MKEYLTEYLSYGFITANNYPYILLVLFVKKLSSSLRFCINYCKLNTLMKKDAYLILRINKLLA